MPALWIAHVDVTDPDAYADYIKVASEQIPAHGGVFIARGGAFEQLEGRAYPRNVVARFPSMEAARACYNSPEYQAVVPTAMAASERSVMILEIEGEV
ncbi:MAG: DUF1330 domain-containing protein [Pseudomonadota bacterium]